MMGKTKNKKINTKNFQKVLEEQEPENSKTLIFCGILLAISSIGLLIFVLSDKVFHLN